MTDKKTDEIKEEKKPVPAAPEDRMKEVFTLNADEEAEKEWVDQGSQL